ncbi:hypothetical protein AGLY_006883 [Aphis glycines]|uniref:Multiple inositol polyphosphate phosphatase 1 n=1 Tax=Aphis glycines TaxID=307491 RepID=A0A6G0TQ35_APHGL|nr:hypothetical protein AGLY_006883 [Aphis glycines]
MLVFIAILLSTSQVLAKFRGFKDPIFPQYPNDMKSIPFRLGSMTPYHPPDKTCVAIRCHCTVRHGAKYPKEDVQTEISGLNFIQEYLNARYKDENALNALPKENREAILKIMKWVNKTSSKSAKEINQHGLQTMYKLGSRWNSRLLNIVTSIESEKDIEFNSAIEDRCVLSGQEFLRGFLKIQKGKDSTVIEIPLAKVPKKGDHRIKLDKGKPEVKEPKVKKPDEEEVEIKFFNKVCPQETCYLREKIVKLLFPSDDEWETWRNEITSARIRAMYMACANSYVYDYSNEEEGHAWCHVFDIDDIIMFENMHDYQYYIKNGYNDIKTKNYGHPMMRDILGFLDKKDTEKFKLFASHTSNCLSLITGFRMFEDKDKLSLKNMTEGDKMSNRKWKSSLLGNYACNIMVVVYECENANYEISEEEEVSIFLNETPLEMVFENEITCTQCPIDAVKNLIIQLLKDTPTDEELKEYENLQKGKIVQEKIGETSISESSVKT